MVRAVFAEAISQTRITLSSPIERSCLPLLVKITFLTNLVLPPESITRLGASAALRQTTGINMMSRIAIRKARIVNLTAHMDHALSFNRRRWEHFGPHFAQ